MPSNQPSKTGTAFEYFLYAAILAETALAALVYKALFSDGELAHLRLYFAVFYFAFLGWAIAQLNRLHRHRKSLAGDPAAPVLGASEEGVQNAARPALGLTSEQLITVVLVFATAVAAFTWLLRTLD
jgi:hypothetical protein